MILRIYLRESIHMALRIEADFGRDYEFGVTEVPKLPHEILAEAAVQTFGDPRFVRRALRGVERAASMVFADPEELIAYTKRAIEGALEGASPRRAQVWRDALDARYPPEAPQLPKPH